ncbi:Tom37 domain-containing protein [Rhodotorula toruloides]|nr:Tom37 domain-containing protein [Rhodotorula toruloides]
MPMAGRYELHCLPGSHTHDLASLDPHSLASYLQLLCPGEWTIVDCSDPGLSPSGSLPFLKRGPDTFAGSAILAHLLQANEQGNGAVTGDAKAFQALLDTTVLPLVLHSLYSLPQNWLFIRSLLIPSLPWPSAFYRPNALRASARTQVDALHPDWWGLGGEAEKEAEDERRRKKALLETGVEGIRERKEEERREGKERMKKTFGEGKIVSAARQVFTALESTLAASSTPFFFSSPSPSPLDAHLSSLLSLALYLPLPTPILADLINASFPRLWTHTALLRRTLWSSDSLPLPPTRSSASSSLTASFTGALKALFPLPSPFSPRLTRHGAPISSHPPLTKQDLSFRRKRYTFFAVCAVGVVGWAVGTGQMPLPFGGRLGRLMGGGAGRRGWVRFRAGEEGEGEDEWEEGEEDEDDEEEDDQWNYFSHEKQTPAMPLFNHSSAAQPTPATHEKPLSSSHTGPNSPATSAHPINNAAGATGATGVDVGDQNGTGKAWIYQRPSVGEWFKMYWVDLLTMAAIGAVGLGVYFADPAPTRNFPITFSDGEIVYPEVAYPLRKNIIPIWAAAMIAFFVPFVSFLLVQIRVRCFEDLNTATFGVLYSLITAACFQVFIKWLIGGLRPHFLAVCKPVIPAGLVGTGFQNIMFDRSVCTGDAKEINDSLESMPSGHSTAAWAGLLFLSLYLNGKLKVFSDYRPQFWKMIAFFAPLLGAFLISGSLTIDEFHHWYDVLVGGLIGSSCALAAYRMSYASILDFRFNHLPLPRTPPSSTAHHNAHFTPRFPYTLEAVNGQARDSGVPVFAGQWREMGGMGGAGVQGAPGDAVKGAVGSGMGRAERMV